MTNLEKSTQEEIREYGSYFGQNKPILFFIVVEPFAAIFFIPIPFFTFSAATWYLALIGVLISIVFKFTKLPRRQVIRFLIRKFRNPIIVPTKKQLYRDRLITRRWPY